MVNKSSGPNCFFLCGRGGGGLTCISSSNRIKHPIDQFVNSLKIVYNILLDILTVKYTVILIKFYKPSVRNVFIYRSTVHVILTCFHEKLKYQTNMFLYSLKLFFKFKVSEFVLIKF